MGLVEKIKSFIEDLADDIAYLLSSIDELRDVSEDRLSFVRSNMDSNGVFTTITYRREDNTIYKISNLSGGTSPQYTTRTTTFYKKDGVSIKYTYTYTLGYSGTDLISETLV